MHSIKMSLQHWRALVPRNICTAPGEAIVQQHGVRFGKNLDPAVPDPASDTGSRWNDDQLILTKIIHDSGLTEHSTTGPNCRVDTRVMDFLKSDCCEIPYVDRCAAEGGTTDVHLTDWQFTPDTLPWLQALILHHNLLPHQDIKWLFHFLPRLYEQATCSSGPVLADGLCPTIEQPKAANPISLIYSWLFETNPRVYESKFDISTLDGKWKEGAELIMASPHGMRRSNKGEFTVTLPFSKLPIHLPGSEHQKWWEGVEKGSWEPATLRAFNQEIRPGMTYIGFGEWIGVTGLFAAARVKRAIMMDADPQVLDALRENMRHNFDAFKGNMALDPRCISSKEEVISMQVHGGSGSHFSQFGDLWNDSVVSWSTVDVSCVPLPMLVEEYGLSTDRDRLFVKIDTEGAESLILPSLTEWVQQAKIKPTFFVSMHSTSTLEQKDKIAELLNIYPYYAVFRGRESPETEAAMLDEVADPQNGGCNQGVPLLANSEHNRFAAETVCNWCDYLLVTDTDRAAKMCPTHPIPVHPLKH